MARLRRIRWKKIIGKIIISLVTIVIGIIVVVIVLFYSTRSSFEKKVFSYMSIDKVRHHKAAIIFGAGLDGDLKTPSQILKDRVEVGVELYKQDKVDFLIMSGDNRYNYYDEPGAMIEYAKSLGVPDNALQPDYAGRRTYDTCLRAKEVFNLDEVILVTQDFHMTRAMYTCENLDLEVIGVKADKHTYDIAIYLSLREQLAFALALWEINLDPPNNVVLGDTIPLE